MKIAFHGLPSAVVADIRRTQIDAYGNPVEEHMSDGDAYPCRHCLGAIPKGQTYLILAHCPFETRNPYAETGPIFLCATDCAPAPHRADLPAILLAPDYIVRGYGADERIQYGTGQMTPTDQIATYAAHLLDRDDVAFVDVRSARNNCFQCRIWPAS